MTYLLTRRRVTSSRRCRITTERPEMTKIRRQKRRHRRSSWNTSSTSSIFGRGRSKFYLERLICLPLIASSVVDLPSRESQPPLLLPRPAAGARATALCPGEKQTDSIKRRRRGLLLTSSAVVVRGRRSFGLQSNRTRRVATREKNRKTTGH